MESNHDSEQITQEAEAGESLVRTAKATQRNLCVEKQKKNDPQAGETAGPCRALAVLEEAPGC